MITYIKRHGFANSCSVVVLKRYVLVGDMMLVGIKYSACVLDNLPPTTDFAPHTHTCL